MMGEVLFGGLIYALQGERPYVERGWIKQCKSPDNWNVVPRNDVGTRECGFTPLKLEKCNAN
jgi:hypothetical protein